VSLCCLNSPKSAVSAGDRPDNRGSSASDGLAKITQVIHCLFCFVLETLCSSRPLRPRVKSLLGVLAILGKTLCGRYLCSGQHAASSTRHTNRPSSPLQLQRITLLSMDGLNKLSCVGWTHWHVNWSVNKYMLCLDWISRCIVLGSVFFVRCFCGHECTDTEIYVICIYLTYWS